MFETTNQSWIFIGEIDGKSTEQNNWAPGLASRPSSSFSLRRPEWTLTPSCANLGAENQPLGGVPILGFFGWEEFRCQSFSKFCGWETLGIEGSIFLGYVELGKPGRGQLKGGGVWKIKSLTFQSKNQKKKRENFRIQRENYSLKSNNQEKKIQLENYRQNPWLSQSPLGSAADQGHPAISCNHKMARKIANVPWANAHTPWSTLSIQHSFPLLSPKAFKNFAQLTGFDLFWYLILFVLVRDIDSFFWEDPRIHFRHDLSIPPQALGATSSRIWSEEKWHHSPHIWWTKTKNTWDPNLYLWCSS